MIVYEWTGLDADGNKQSCTTSRPLTHTKLLAVVAVFQDRGWIEVTGTDLDGNEVAGLADSVAWASR